MKKQFQLSEPLELNSLNIFVNRNNSTSRRDWQMAHVWIKADGSFQNAEIINTHGTNEEVNPSEVDFVDENGNLLFN